MSRSELKERAKLFWKQKTFVNIKHKLPSGKIVFYNGYIEQVYEDFIQFNDRYMPNTFPIYFESILNDIEPSQQVQLGL